MKKIILILLILSISFYSFSQTTQDVVDQLSGEYEQNLIDLKKATIVEVVGLSMMSIPVVLFPFTAFELGLEDQTKTNITASFYTFSFVSAVVFFVGFGLSQKYKKEAFDSLNRLYEYQKILDQNDQYTRDPLY